MKTYQTYIHIRNDTGQVFYVGAGSEKRPYDKNKKPDAWHLAAQNGYTVELCSKWPTPQEAADHETLLIQCFRDLGHPLVNKRLGGGGGIGHQLSSESRLKISEANIGRIGAMLGKTHTPEARAKLSLRQTGKPSPMKGRSMSAEARARISAANMGKNNPNFGKQISIEQKEKLSIAQKNYLLRKNNSHENAIA